MPKHKKMIKNHYAIAEAPPPADTSFITRKYLNQSYACQSAAQKLDIYLPEAGDGPFPVILAIHGGAFMGCDKADMQVLPMLCGLQRGYAVVSINYRLSGEAKFPALVQDAKAAVRWVRANAACYKLDPTRIAAWGGSAGGYQALMLGVSAGVRDLEDLSMGNPEQPCNVQAVVAWFSPVNFLTLDAQLAENGLLGPPGMRHNDSHSPEALLLGRKITSLPVRVRAANPETYIHGRNAAVLSPAWNPGPGYRGAAVDRDGGEAYQCSWTFQGYPGNPPGRRSRRSYVRNHAESRSCLQMVG